MSEALLGAIAASLGIIATLALGQAVRNFAAAWALWRQQSRWTMYYCGIEHVPCAAVAPITVGAPGYPQRQAPTQTCRLSKHHDGPHSTGIAGQPIEWRDAE